MFETVFEPAMKAPNAPTVALNAGECAADYISRSKGLAAVTGILGRSAPFLTPELMKIRTIGMVNTNTKLVNQSLARFTEGFSQWCCAA